MTGQYFLWKTFDKTNFLLNIRPIQSFSKYLPFKVNVLFGRFDKRVRRRGVGQKCEFVFYRWSPKDFKNFARFCQISSGHPAYITYLDRQTFAAARRNAKRSVHLSFRTYTQHHLSIWEIWNNFLNGFIIKMYQGFLNILGNSCTPWPEENQNENQHRQMIFWGKNDNDFCTCTPTKKFCFN